ncbi:MAG: cyclic pyranopterin monophosphate synthase MoaC [Desulfobacteraceae bacterium]|nr:cyclic pyranopterin monophosphate synthase MoaC [Desulfobacteraceae bacterium]MCB9494306.1 cyclic pyranopterin monophosphate synthase MoaC [Desulfobacteraceae bacterium]
MKEFTHLDSKGRVNMVDISDKYPTKRTAVAKSEVHTRKDTIEKIISNGVAKGNVVETAKLTGITAAKKTSELIFLCHPIKITGIDFDFKINETSIEIFCKVTANDQTGAEMEALTGVSLAALAIYDMCKAYDKRMTITNTMLLKKTGGKSGDFVR